MFNRIAMDAASLNFRHVRLDENGGYTEEIPSGLNNCLTVEANLDQTHRAFIQDAVHSMLDEGCVAIVPVDTDIDPRNTTSVDIRSMRTGRIVEWYPKYVKVNLYNEQTGKREDVTLPKSMVAVIENPLYSIVNEPNSTMQRLIRKLNLLDISDEKTSSGKLDMIIQLPYIIRTKARREQAEARRKDIEEQLAEGKYGIAYTDGTEKITQLNRPVENNLMAQIEYLTSMLYSQLGLTQAVMDGSADEATMSNYYTRTIEPLAAAITDELRRKFLSKTARTQGQTVTFFRDPFKLIPISNIAEIADKFTRNQIMTANEIRQKINMKPSRDPDADRLKNANIAESKQQKMLPEPNVQPNKSQVDKEISQNGS
ncbi:MAG: phage portal protein [Bacteroidaceae bacterium]|nr:phage portal protein [Bacteroidaceae bacterium]